MKRILMIIMGFILLLCLSCCIVSDKQDFYGTYKFEKVSYLSPLSSSTINSMNDRMMGTKYIIEKNLFKIESAGSTVEISSPNYVKEEVQSNLSRLYNTDTIDGNKVDYQYTICDKDGNKQIGDCMFLQRICGLLSL